MSNRMRVAWVVGLLIAHCAIPALAWSQIPGRSFRSAIPSRVVPAENVEPVEEQEPTPAQPLRASEPRPIPVAEEPRVLPAETLPEPVEAKVAWRPAQTSSTNPIRAGISKDPPGVATSKLLPKTTNTTPDSDATTENDDAADPRGVTTLVRNEVQQVWQRVLDVWKYNFFVSSDEHLKLSLQVIVCGIFLLWLGHVLSRRLSMWLGSSVLRRVGLPAATAAPLQKMSYYAIFAIFAASSLRFVGIPLDGLTFLGGALAIGIGFGSQNVMNNFISGLILLIERPIRVGDVIQIDSHSGKVSEIGARSTRITTGSNLEVIIPNSTFLQGNVVNWTLSDDTISSKVSVGVAYGSPAREVARLLKQAAEENDQILETPGPGVSFTEFSDHAMQFELSFWLKMSQADRGKVESDLRFKIDELFADRGIVIAYPQRDVHLNLMRPVEVRLTESTIAPRELRGAA